MILTNEQSKGDKRIKRRSSHDLIHWTNRAVDLLMRIGPHEVLNSGGPNLMPTNPALELRHLANGLKAEAVDDAGKHIDYAKLSTSEIYKRFIEYTRALPYCDITKVGDNDEKMAFWINLYNVLILNAVIHYQISDSIISMPSIFRRAAFNVGGYRFSADDIEHGILRRNQPHPFLRLRQFGHMDPRIEAMVEFVDARLHFALVCGASSCPPIAFYDGPQLDSQLSMAASSFINGGGATYDERSSTLWLSKIFKWYLADFGGIERVKRLIRQVSMDSELCDAIDAEDVRIRYLPYDWSVNRMV